MFQVKPEKCFFEEGLVDNSARWSRSAIHQVTTYLSDFLLFNRGLLAEEPDDLQCDMFSVQLSFV